MFLKLQEPTEKINDVFMLEKAFKLFNKSSICIGNRTTSSTIRD